MTFQQLDQAEAALDQVEAALDQAEVVQTGVFSRVPAPWVEGMTSAGAVTVGQPSQSAVGQPSQSAVGQPSQSADAVNSLSALTAPELRSLKTLFY
jgi:hypothetical protein